MIHDLPNTAWRLVLAGCLLWIAGCGPSRPETAPVKGKVTLGGKALTGGTIVFHPAEGRPAMASIGADGTYALTTFQSGDGALLGTHRVTIEASEVSAVGLPKSPEEELRIGLGGPATVQWIVPEMYAGRETTPLTAEVTHGENRVDFDLPAQ